MVSISDGDVTLVAARRVARCQMDAMNPSYTETSFAMVDPQPWEAVFRKAGRTDIPPEAIDLLSKMLLVRVAACSRVCPACF